MDESEDNRGIVVLLSILLIIVIGAILALLFLNRTTALDNSATSSSSSSLSSTSSSSSSSASVTTVVVNSPVEDQIFSAGRVVAFTGQAKGFFENTFYYRLINSNDDQILLSDDVIVPDSESEFVEFDTSITVPNPLPENITNGRLEIYSISARDGTETIITSISIAFAQPE